MTEYQLYPNLPWGPETPGSVPHSAEGPSALPENLQVGFHLNVIKAKRQGVDRSRKDV